MAHIPTDDPQEALAYCRRLAAAGTASESVSLSVVLPIHNEQENIPELHRRLQDALSPLLGTFELVFVNDGSSDNSLRLLRDIAETQRNVRVVDLARNFGHQIAISAGMVEACGDAVIVMDGDLQDPPEVLPDLIAELRSGYDVVYAIRKQRKESWAKRVCYACFYRTLRKLANVEIPLDSGDFCIMDRRVVDLLNSMPERNRFVRGIRSWVGLRQTGLEYERHARNAGQATYTWRSLILLALDGFISFSQVPLRLAALFGGVVSILSLAMAAFFIVKKLLIGLDPPGFATIITAIFFFAGVQLLTLGMLGEYIGRIFDEVKRRPLYIVREVIGKQDAE